MRDGTLAFTLVRLGMCRLAIIAAAAALVVGVSALESPRAAFAEDDTDCEVTDLGTLSAEMDRLEAEGRWTTEDCDSQFRAGSDAHTYRIELPQPGRVRVDLTSAEGDAYLYLMAEDGSRITEDDDGNNILNSRIERELAAGVYLIEATTVGGRGRGAADFTLSITLLTDCGPVDLGALTSGTDLTASGSWGLDTCASQFLKDHPALVYVFTMPQGGRVRIDLTSPTGDPVLAVTAADGIVVDANDDGGGFRNSRVEPYLTPGVYIVEATTYRERGLQPLSSDFELVIHLVDEDAERGTFNLKIETIHTPDQVVAGEPFTVHYRAGNLGGGHLADAGGYAVLYVVAPRASDRTRAIYGSADRWQAGVSYHSGSQTATVTSVAIDEVKPFTITLNTPGPSWVFVAAIVFDEEDEEIGFHGIWQDLDVLSGPTFDPVTVQVDGATYEVSATADSEGLVTTSVTSVTDPEAESDPALRERAIYAAGVRTQLLDGIFERPAIAALPATADPAEISIANASSSTLRKAFTEQYANAVAVSGLTDVLARGEAINPVAVEDLILRVAESAAAQYASLAASWSAIQERITGGEALSFTDAFALQTELAYAERILSSAITAGEIVAAARGAEGGWQAPTVQGMAAVLARQAACGGGSEALRSALEATDAEGVDGLLALDAELRTALPIHGLATDSALCAAAEADAATGQFLQRLALAGTAVHQLLVPEPPELPEPRAAPTPHQLRITARLLADGQIELGVELADGEQILPLARLLLTDVTINRWHVSSSVEVDGSTIGEIRVRRLAAGRVELGFRSAEGTALMPDLRYLGADLPVGVWLRSSAIEVPPAAPASE